jgi:hypothetical protein
MNFFKKIFKTNYDESITNYSDFWKWFTKNEKKFHKVIKEGNDLTANFFNIISSKLDQLNDGYFYITGMYDENTAELILTADGNINKIIFIEELVNEAPNINGWKFTAHKSATDISNLLIKMNEDSFSSDNISFYSNENSEYPDEIDITLVHNDYNEENKNNIIRGTYIFLDNLLGELNSISILDNVVIVGPKDATKDLVPISKLNDFLKWRQKEFIEKYDGIRHNTENDAHSIFESELKNGNISIAVINTELIKWDAKASHPWMAKIEIKYDGTETRGMPENDVQQLLYDIEEEIMIYLKDSDGYLNTGRETSDGSREIYFACRDFRKPSKILAEIVKKYKNKIEISFDIYKDKYWATLSHYENIN